MAKRIIKPRVIRPLPVPTILEVPHEGRIVKFAYLHGAKTNDSHRRVTRSILSQRVYVPEGKRLPQKELQRLRLPKPEETISLIHTAALDRDARRAFEFFSIGTANPPRSFHVHSFQVWTDEGVYMYNEPTGADNFKPLRIPDGTYTYKGEVLPNYRLGVDRLEEKLSKPGVLKVGGVRVSEDRTVAFAPKESYVLDEEDSTPLQFNGFAIALARGIEGARKLSEVEESVDRYYSPKIVGPYFDNFRDSSMPVVTHAAILNDDFGFEIQCNGSGYLPGGPHSGISLGVLE